MSQHHFEEQKRIAVSEAMEQLSNAIDRILILEKTEDEVDEICEMVEGLLEEMA